MTPAAKGAAAAAGKVKEEEKPQYAGDRVMRNMSALNKIRVFVACTSGALAGVLGLTGAAGFAFFAAMSLLTTVYMHAVVLGLNAGEFFMPDQKLYGIGSLLSAIVTYIVVWTVAYDVAHVF
eukprot:Rhum_TRINITY_DN3676_c0_g1::Rhum_TRINITY_DN3676_c0_g1_i1::g.11662::m.11662